MKQNFNDSFEKVYELVSKIPPGKVTTYGEIGKVLNMSPRLVGYALHTNPYGPEIPCHRVVNREGRLAPHYAFGGSEKQKEKLEKEGITFKDETHVDMEKYFIGEPFVGTTIEG